MKCAYYRNHKSIIEETSMGNCGCDYDVNCCEKPIDSPSYDADLANDPMTQIECGDCEACPIQAA